MTKPTIDWLRYLPSVLLIAVSCSQIWLAYSADLSPWSGGGFGMFSTLDAGGKRHLHAFAMRPGIRRELQIPRDMKEQVLRTLTLPTETALVNLASEFANLPTPDEGPLEAIQIQVWTAHFDPDTLEPSSSLLHSIEVRFGEY